MPLGTQLGAYKSVGATFSGAQGLFLTANPFTLTESE